MTFVTVAKEKFQKMTDFFGLAEDQEMQTNPQFNHRQIPENRQQQTTNIVAENTRIPVPNAEAPVREEAIRETRMSRISQAAKGKQKNTRPVKPTPVYQDDVLRENVRIPQEGVQVQQPQETPVQPNRSARVDETYENVRVDSVKADRPAMAKKTQSEASGENIVKKVSILEPRTYTESKTIAQCIFRNEIAIVNFHLVDESQARRIVDFLTGAVFALDGDIQRLGGEIFICTPPNTEIDSATAKSLLETQFKEY
ncbi:cell division protein SepF [Vagococcus sp. PNs007]|uniref:Cell division protein SepF n=1 Tax=Vagococcus proximus TaxID=2991417 RepID=A0ABT5X0A3_9ENTE|nr:cell division protein SepF [Vagococcus proximus]MDF0479433.1 cell division protein SepF [Vagococcus proximus]